MIGFHASRETTDPMAFRRITRDLFVTESPACATNYGETVFVFKFPPDTLREYLGGPLSCFSSGGDWYIPAGTEGVQCVGVMSNVWAVWVYNIANRRSEYGLASADEYYDVFRRLSPKWSR